MNKSQAKKEKEFKDMIQNTIKEELNDINNVIEESVEQKSENIDDGNPLDNKKIRKEKERIKKKFESEKKVVIYYSIITLVILVIILININNTNKKIEDYTNQVTENCSDE
tara:strand:- start:1136 stop:1468 length:333 start_codon:yes stop_codon:yes gene_type:complete